MTWQEKVSLVVMVVAFSLGASARVGDTQEIPFPRAEWGWESFAASELPPSTFVLDDLKIGVASKQDIVARYGESEVFRVQAMSYFADLICFRERAPDSTRDSLIIFEFGPLGGWDLLTAIVLASDGSLFAENDKCTLLSGRKDLKTQNGIRLGMNLEEVQKIIGGPAYSEGGRVAFRHQSRGTDESGNAYDISAGLEAYFEHSGMTWMRVYREESY